jgi:hypothetical protein
MTLLAPSALILNPPAKAQISLPHPPTPLELPRPSLVSNAHLGPPHSAQERLLHHPRSPLFLFFYVGLGFKFRTLHLQSRHPTA